MIMLFISSHDDNAMVSRSDLFVSSITPGGREGVPSRIKLFSRNPDIILLSYDIGWINDNDIFLLYPY